jgi:radical SAM protein with 4Fe4S-binding SPASM domain
MSFKNQGYGCWSGECDTKFHTIDSNGYKHGCTALTSEQDNKVTKDIVTKIVWFKKDENQKNTILETRKIRQESCIDCEFIKICSSGCLSVEKFDESNECSGAKTLFKTIKKLI